MSNSPPSNVKLRVFRDFEVLASGIDSLAVSMQVAWQSERAFQLLSTLKAMAKSSTEDEPAKLEVSADSAKFFFNVKPHGKDGYEWMFSSSEFTFKVGNWLLPRQRPSILAEVRSESLWMHGPDACVDRLVQIVAALDGRVMAIKSSRADLCVDILLPVDCWTRELERCFVTRAIVMDPHTRNRKLTGFSIGKGLVSARLYDKPAEIATKSGKFWMYDIWGVEHLRKGFVIIRVEFQFRRDRLKELGCDTWADLQDNLLGLWAYGTRKWLRLVNDAELHHTQQDVLPWWTAVMDGFKGAQTAEPLVREKSISFELQRHAAQVMGGMSSIVALLNKDSEIDASMPLDMKLFTDWALEEARAVSTMTDAEFTKRVLIKQAKYHRCSPGFEG